MQIKICGITQPDQAHAIAQLGVAAIGFICVRQSPRYVSPEQIGFMVQRLMTIAPSQPIDRVGVFVDAPLAEIQQVVTTGNLTGVQLHGSESPQFCQQLREQLPHVKLIKAFRVRDPHTLEQTRPYQSVVDALLLDAFDPAATHPGLYGGTGHTIAWEMLQQFQPECAWFLAGGITPENVHLALDWVQPDGIDVSSGVEHAPGHKDIEKVVALLAALQQIKSYANAGV